MYLISKTITEPFSYRLLINQDKSKSKTPWDEIHPYNQQEQDFTANQEEVTGQCERKTIFH